MTSFTASSMRWLRRLLGGGVAAAPDAGAARVLDGLSAVAVTEALLADTAGLGATFPASAAARAWRQEQDRPGLNALGEARGGVEGLGPRAALAAALGAATAGQRATAFVSGPDLVAATDLLAQTAGRRAPLVVHLAARAPAGHAQALGSGHEAWHAAADLGWLQLFATSVQEAVDLALVARRVAERALVPALVAMDTEQTALAVQDVRLPEPELVARYLGAAHDVIEAPTGPQRIIFGDTRRRVPRQHDLDRPMMLAPLVGPEAWALGTAGARAHLDGPVPALLAEALDELAERTGRRPGPVHAHGVDDARIVLVAQGAAVETAVAVADAARRRDGRKVGVLGVRCLRPLPAGEIAAALAGADVAAVLERADAPLGGDGPLLREIRSALDRARENARFGAGTHPGCPAIPDAKLPRLVDVPFGLGGLPLRAADLAALLESLAGPPAALPPRLHLGLDFVRPASVFPKHQALLDALRRMDPDLERLGLRSDAPPPEVRPAEAVTIAFHRTAGGERDALAGETAALLHALLGGRVRSRPALTWQRFDEPCVDLVTHADDELLDPGDDAPVDIAVAIGAPPRVAAPGPALLVVPAPAEPDAPAWETTEAALGGIIALVLARRGETAPPESSVRAARAAALADRPDDERERRLDRFMAAAAS
ncbi:MAG: hypothetical protein ACYTG1_05890, partial [Planctomycetota bacterium]